MRYKLGKLYFDPKNLDVCEPMSTEFVKSINHLDEALFASFIIANRGNCSFVQKVRNMERAGAALAIVVDTNE